MHSTDMKRKTEQPHLSATIQARRLSLFGSHIAWMPDESDAKQILTETTGTSPYYVVEDYPAGPGITEPLSERDSLAENRPL